LGDEFLARTRHLAALGLSQETDALVIIVSEEAGTISVAIKGRLERGLGKKQLKEKLINYLK
jgi:diadenylate cyclase